MEYYSLIFPTSTEPTRSIGASIQHNNNISVSIGSSDPVSMTSVELTKEEAIKLMYHLQDLISLVPLIDA